MSIELSSDELSLQTMIKDLINELIKADTDVSNSFVTFNGNQIQYKVSFVSTEEERIISLNFYLSDFDVYRQFLIKFINRSFIYITVNSNPEELDITYLFNEALIDEWATFFIENSLTFQRKSHFWLLKDYLLFIKSVD